MLLTEDQGSRQSLKLVRQEAPNDCGPACLTIVLHHFGIQAPLHEVRECFDVKYSGVSALDLIIAASSFGLSGRGISVPTVEDLKDLSTGAVLHWKTAYSSHFFVFETLTPNSVVVMDPELGRQEIELKRFSKHFGKLAIVFSQ